MTIKNNRLPQWCTILLILLLSFNQCFASVISFKKESDAVLIKLDKGLLKIRICAADIVQVNYTLHGTLPAKSSLVFKNDSWIKKTPFTVTDRDGQLGIVTAKLRVTVDKRSQAITYTDTNGKVILAETTANKVMEPAVIAGINTYKCSTGFRSPEDEGLYGLGCHPTDTLSVNYKGREQDMAIQYMTGAIPVLVSTRGYGLLWDNYSASAFYGAEDNNSSYKYVSESGEAIDYYFFYGPSLDGVISSYRRATGIAPMFPKWAFGLFQSQDRYKTQAEVLSVKDNYRNNHIPVDAIVQDWYYWEPLPIGSHVMNPANYPDPRSMVGELHKANIHAMISIWPVYGIGSKSFDAMKSAGGITAIDWQNPVSKTTDYYYDVYNPSVRKLYWAQTRDSLVKRYDWDAWWIDQCEPDNNGNLDARRKADFAIGKGIDYFNTYSLAHTDGIYGGWRKDIPGKRAFFLVRQAFAGQQRNSMTLWSSDITCTFRSYKSQVPQAINSAASGIPYWTSDIGGYRDEKWNSPNWSLPANRELFTRWFQFGTFCPVFRIHGKGERALFSSNWDDQMKATLLKFDRLRYRLLPYIYSLAGRVTLDNYTIMRPLAFDFPDDPAVRAIPDQYLFGPAFLVNPVTEQLYTGPGADKKVKTRKVYLPGGTWYDFWTGKKFAGSQTYFPEVPMDKLPLYIRAGSIVPMGPVMEYATEKPADTIELRIYRGADGEFRYYEDENDNYNYEKGAYAQFTLSWNDRLGQLNISDTKGNFSGMLKKHTFNVVLVDEAHGNDVREPVKIDKTVVYGGKKMSVAFN